MNILIADALSQGCITQLEQEGYTVFNEPALKGEALTEAMGTMKPQVLIVTFDKSAGRNHDGQYGPRTDRESRGGI